MKLLLIFLILPYFTLLNSPDRPEAGIPFLNTDLNEVREIAGQKGSLYFAFFTADWCAPCRWMEDQSFEDPRLIQYVRKQYLAVRIDIDQRNGRIHQERYQVTMLPSILIFNAQGQLLARIETALSSDDLLQILKEHNLPKNRIGSAAKNYATVENILDSPKPQIKLYRPPLSPEEDVNPVPTPANPPRPLVIPVNRTEPPDKVPEFRPARETFAPRSEQNYSIQIATHHTYEQAIRQVAQLERGFKEPVQLLNAAGTDGRQVFRVFIGMFPQKRSAEDYLYYLRRKNINGIIKDMHVVRSEK